MRVVVLIPDLRHDLLARARTALQSTRARRFLSARIPLWIREVRGGTLNLMRHCAVARSLGVDAVLATARGRDVYGPQLGIGTLPFIRWSQRQPDDVCIVPDIYTYLIDAVAAAVVAYEQSPEQVHNDFDHTRANVSIWADSPLMVDRCRAAYPGTDVTLVPNVVDPIAFPFLESAYRTPGELIAFPRKGAAFIDATYRRYRELGGRYWQLQRVDGLPFYQLAARFRTPQAFLASADVEGCALPPQEAMAAGIVVVGRSAGGANFCMRHNETALVAETAEDAAAALRSIEDAAVRMRLSGAAYEYIQRFFPKNEPTQFWRDLLSRHP